MYNGCGALCGSDVLIAGVCMYDKRERKNKKKEGKKENKVGSIFCDRSSDQEHSVQLANHKETKKFRKFLFDIT